MKDLYYVKWDCITKKGKHYIGGFTEYNAEQDEVSHWGQCVFAESESEAIYKATKGWKNVKLTQVRKYQEIERKEF